MYEDILKKTYPFWNRLTDSEKSILTSDLKRANFKKGETVLRTDIECEGGIVLLSGVLRVYIMSEEGREITLFRMFPTENCILSASCLLETIAFDTVIEATEEASAIIIPVNEFKLVMESNPHVAVYVYKHTTERFSDVMWAMQQILFLGIDKRVAGFLWDEMIRKDDPVLKLTHEEIAHNIGSVREVVTKIIKYLSDENILTTSRGQISILDREKLKSLI